MASLAVTTTLSDSLLDLFSLILNLCTKSIISKRLILTSSALSLMWCLGIAASFLIVNEAWSNFDCLFSAADMCIPKCVLRRKRKSSWLSDDTLAMVKKKKMGIPEEQKD